jgi:cytochrome c oxidase subunit 2
MTVVQLSIQLTGSDNDDEQIRHNKANGIGFLIFMVAGLGLMVYMTIRYAKYMLPTAASEHGGPIDNLLNINFLIIGIVFFITQITLFYFANKYRHNHNRKAYFYPENHKLELIWTVVPAIVLSVLITTGLKQWNKILLSNDEHPNAMNVQVYGMQFQWVARYSGADNALGKSNFRLIADDNVVGLDLNDPAAKDDIISGTVEMHLPVNQGVMFTFNAREVIHSAYFPHFRAQMNCVPGMNTRFYFEPIYTTKQMREMVKDEKFDYVLLCNKVCGVAHYTMKMKVVIDTREDYEKWLATQKKATDIAPAGGVIKVADRNSTEIGKTVTM